MPNKHTKSRNNSRKSTRSNTPPQVNPDDDGYSGLLKIPTPSSRRSTPKSVSSRPDFLEPLSPTSIEVQAPPTPPSSPWDVFGMTQEDFLAMQARVSQRMYEYDRECYIQNVLNEMDTPGYWIRRIEHLEKQREYFNKKRGWSAADIVCVERIDEEIEECEQELNRLYDEEDRLEAEYD